MWRTCLVRPQEYRNQEQFYVDISYFAVLTPEEVISSQAVAITFADRVLGTFAWIVPLCVCLSTSGSLNGSYLSGGRMPFVAARAGQWPKVSCSVGL